MTQDEIDKLLPSLYDSCTFKGLGRRFLISHYSHNNGSRVIIGCSERSTLKTLREIYVRETNIDSVDINFAQSVNFVTYPKTQFLTIARPEYRHYKRAWANSIKSEVMEIYKETGKVLPNFLLCPENKVAASDLFDDEELKEYLCESHSYCINCNSGYGILFDSKFDEDALYLSTLKPNINQSFSDEAPTHTIENGYYGLNISEYEQKKELEPNDLSVYGFPYASFTLRGFDFKASAELVIIELKELDEKLSLESKQFKATREVERKSKEREKFFTQLKLLGLA